MLRSKRITVREAQKSEPSPKENKPTPRKQVQGDHERKRNGRPRRLEAQKKKHQEGKEAHGKRLKKIARILSNHQETRILPGT